MPLPRAVPRHAQRLVVRLRGMLPVYTRDVSDQGFQADLLQPLHPGRHVQGAICLGQDEVPFEGEIVWTRHHAGERVRGRWGLRFTTLPADFARRLQSLRARQGRRLVRWFT
ncbi:PilZ domain-containing protein [Myxococcaceae bacterium GXIMD 01537]